MKTPRRPEAGGDRGGGAVREAAAAVAVSPSRAAAYAILAKVMTSAAHSDDLLHAPAVSRLSVEDRNLTTALVLGVLRWQMQLDTVLRSMLERPDADLHPAALLALRLGLFQLLRMDRIPAHAAVNESVQLARENGAAHAAGMVNAVLRRVLREREAPKKQPLVVLQTPEEQAHPAWLMERWRTNFGAAAARRIAAYDQAEPPSHGLLQPDDVLPQIDDGSRLVAELAAVASASPKRILDCCAAPGGKTAVLAVRHPSAEIVACDVSAKRLEAMRARMDANPATRRVKTRFADMTHPQEELGRFDLILCDAPCSGTGTLARNPEIRHRLRETDLARQAERQVAILQTAARLLANDGRLVYSTCSLEPEENAAVLAAVPELVVEDAAPLVAQVTSHPDLVSDGVLRTLPGVVPCDGFFAAVLRLR